ncbi:bifunctional methylenetetrahydrofolate dehydrogenase/methenyltetrahydrofolate cyclohydrolase [Thermoplasmatales archaeon ex4484_30]|nr:MAG: bifunctional methylenetetrahydrofolate dehydrogenase/methenyltetrahydrofolate cyclohydrolase [Thermoplasmatales archaeon ex4484_30]
MHIIDGKKIANEMEEEIRKKIKAKIGIATILVGENDASLLYAKLKEKACKRLGFHSQTIHFPSDIRIEEIKEAIRKFNEDDEIHGIVLQLPLPEGMEYETLIKEIEPRKDIEGMHPCNLGATLLNKEFLVPSTPLAVIKILEHEGINVKGKDVVIVNHSNIVGKPLAAMLLNRNATVSICHIYTKDIKKYTSQADILISGTGVAGLIKKEYVKEGAIAIDVGITRKKDGSICGDIDFDAVKEKVKAITPVPGGVGPVTIACLMENAVRAYKKFDKE